MMIQTKQDTWSSRLGVGRGANNPTPQKYLRNIQKRNPKPTKSCGAHDDDDDGDRTERFVLATLRGYFISAGSLVFFFLREITKYHTVTRSRNSIVYSSFVLNFCSCTGRKHPHPHCNSTHFELVSDIFFFPLL